VRFGQPFVVAVLLLAAVPGASAQQPEQNPSAQVALVRAAFDAPYGMALTAELGKSLRKDADPACLSGKGLEASQLEGRGRDLLVKWGTHLMEVTTSLIDPKVYAERFPNSAELERLKQNTDVKRYLAIAEPMRQAKVADGVSQQFSRYVLIARIKLSSLSPLETGNEELLGKNPSSATEDALVKFVTRSKSAALNRFLDLSDQAAAASAASIRKDQVALAGPSAIFKGMEADLAELCIGSRR
jgi:hypothetical protein